MKYLKFTDRDGNVYNFQLSFWIRDNGFSTRSNMVSLDYAHGGKNVADGYIQPRVLTIEGVIRADNAATLESEYRACMKAMLKAGKLSVFDDEVDRYIELKSPTVTSKYTGDYELEIPVQVTYTAEYPFWQDETETTDSEVVAGNTTLSVDNSGSDEFVFPVITIAANQGVDVPSIRMRNQMDGGMEFRFDNSAFYAGAVLTIDCYNGTVYLNNNDAIAFFKPARYLRLQKVVNSILYEGAAATITFKWRKIYL